MSWALGTVAPTATERYADRRRAAIDVWRPPGPGPFPSVLLVHGGGFVIGHRRMRATRCLAEQLCASGIAVAAPDYRLLQHGGSVDGGVRDVCDAMAWWRANAVRFDVGGPVALVGVSAGGALATLAAPLVGPLSALVGVYGLYDFTNVLGRPRLKLPPTALLRTRDPAEWARRSPVQRFDLPIPTLLVHGTHDGIVPIAHTEALAAARASRGLPVEVRRYDGAVHGFLRFPELPESAACVADVQRFLRRWLDPAAPG